MTERPQEINSCEVCGNERLVSVLDLGSHPMCDDLVPIGDTRVCREYPIEILFCATCRTAHQRFQVPKKDLFPASYLFESAEQIVSACGFNIMRQTETFKEKHQFLPFWRRFDDQFLRASRRRATETKN